MPIRSQSRCLIRATMVALLLCLATAGMANVTVIPGANTVRVIDNRLIGPATAATDTFLNKGAGVDALIGSAAGGLSYGRYLYGMNVDTIPLNAIIDTVVIRGCNNTTSATDVEVTCTIHRSDWREGTVDGVYQQKSSSWLCAGAGVMFNGVVRDSVAPGMDTVWVSSGFGGGIPMLDGKQVTTVVPSTATQAYCYWRPTAQFRDSFYTGVRYISFLFYDQTYDGSQERMRMVTSEGAVDSQRIQTTIYWHLPTVDDSTWLRISVVPPSSPLSDYPVLVDFLTYPGTSSTNVTFYASDSVTKLYWWPDSISGHYTRAWVMHDWSSSPDTIFVRRLSTPAMQRADSVFLLYDDFGNGYSVSRPIADWLDYSGVTFDTTGIMLANDPTGVDSVIREPDWVLRDWQESDASKRWKWFYCGERTENPGGTYNDNFLLWASASDRLGTWTKRGKVQYDSSATAYIRAEDPQILWFPNLRKWLMYCEQHNVSSQYHVGIYEADSLDQPIWHFRENIPCLEPSSIGIPTNWLHKEQASPTLCFNPTADTLWMFFEAFTDIPGSGPSRMGLAVSFSNGSGDTLGYDWYLTDSTGAVNQTTPMPIVPWSLAGQKDSVKTIPDAALYLNGHYAVINHGSGDNFWYYGDSPRNLVYMGTADSTHLAEPVSFDTAGGDYISTYTEDLSDDVVSARLRDFDSTRFDNPLWTAHFRSDKSISTNRFLCGEMFESGGVLTMYPPQRQTGCTAIQTVGTFAPGFAIDLWMQATTWEVSGSTEPCTFVSIGGSSLQDQSGNQTQEGSDWSNPRVNTGYSLRIHETATAFLENNSGAAGSNPSGQTSVALGEDTIKTMMHVRLYYMTNDSLVCWVNGVKKCVAKDGTYNASPMRLTVAQGEAAESTKGAVLRIAKATVRKVTTAEATAAAADTLYAAELGMRGMYGRSMERLSFGRLGFGR